MNLSNLKWRLLALIITSQICSYTYAEDELITQQIIVNVTEPGTLSNKIGTKNIYNITNLKLKGNLNIDDIEIVREMGGCYNWQGIQTNGNLQNLDLSDVKFVDSDHEIDVCTEKGIYEFASIGENGFNHYLFASLPKLKTVICPKNSNSNSLFNNCDAIESFKLAPGTTSIEPGMFSNCDALTSVSLPDGIISIGHGAFADCKNLTSIDFPSDLTSIGYAAFNYCTKLRDIKLPSKLESIGDEAFAHCESMTHLIIPSSLKPCDHANLLGWGWQVFQHCYSLKEITIPEGITEIPIGSFLMCKSLSSISLPASLEAIRGSAFRGCSQLMEIWANMNIPATCADDTFGDDDAFGKVDESQCILYVPEGSYSLYNSAEVWRDFNNIVEFAPSGILNIKKRNRYEQSLYYSINGEKIKNLRKGLNIVTYNDGTSKKILTK